MSLGTEKTGDCRCWFRERQSLLFSGWLSDRRPLPAFSLPTRCGSHLLQEGLLHLPDIHHPAPCSQAHDIAVFLGERGAYAAGLEPAVVNPAPLPTPPNTPRGFSEL